MEMNIIEKLQYENFMNYVKAAVERHIAVLKHTDKDSKRFEFKFDLCIEVTKSEKSLFVVRDAWKVWRGRSNAIKVTFELEAKFLKVLMDQCGHGVGTNRDSICCKKLLLQQKLIGYLEHCDNLGGPPLLSDICELLDTGLSCDVDSDLDVRNVDSVKMETVRCFREYVRLAYEKFDQERTVAEFKLKMIKMESAVRVAADRVALANQAEENAYWRLANDNIPVLSRVLALENGQIESMKAKRDQLCTGKRARGGAPVVRGHGGVLEDLELQIELADIRVNWLTALVDCDNAACIHHVRTATRDSVGQYAEYRVSD
jgi:hypothetical protein